MEHLKYPIGRFRFNEKIAAEEVANSINTLSLLPSRLESKIYSLSDSQFTKQYRPEGWTIRQVVHHLADSHANMYIRVKSAISSSGAPVMGYDEGAWAEFADNELPVAVSVQMLQGIHARICHLFDKLEDEDWEKSYFHKGEERYFTLLEVLALYAWHSEHHLAHIDLALKN